MFEYRLDSPASVDMICALLQRFLQFLAVFLRFALESLDAYAVFYSRRSLVRPHQLLRSYGRN
uniref:Uncharacterized protein n=1 Tax=Candidatus Kentrum sp. TC TaxID=2126339 RepID=A0A451A8E8_9GAMM|nr:MAG: hypothetical protein BECKTC1821F_GA0114240_107211 [Candidatus Kentron sp. TC]